MLYKYLHKPGGIYIVKRKIAAVRDTVLTRRQVNSIRRSNRTVYTRNNQLALYNLYTNGEFENPHVLGQACRNASIIIYGKPVKQYGAAFTVSTQTTIETTLLLHEMGHLLGLVNKGSAMQAERSDTAHEAHCINPNCIIYWSIPIKPHYGPRIGKKNSCFRYILLQRLNREPQQVRYF